MMGPGARGRRMALPSLATLIPLLLLLFTSTASAASAVLGIDLGTNFIKAAIVKPGTPLDIVLTKDSKRKEASVVAFKPERKGPVEYGHFPERLYGSDALALGARFPGDVYTHIKTLIGLDPSEASIQQEYKERHPALQVKPAEKKETSVFQSGAFDPKEQPWSVEELLAMELKNIRKNAEVMGPKGVQITEAVITVPSFYTADERRAVERAAELAGINLMGLVSDGLAVAVDYTVKREFPVVSKGGKPEVHLIVDVGAGSTTANVVRFQGREVKDYGTRNKTVQEIAVLGSGWDRTLGGNALNGLIVDWIVDEFMKKSEVSAASITIAEVKSQGRTASRMWTEAEKARQVLSANTDTRLSFEGLYKDIDFSAKLSRSQFETMAAAHAARVSEPLKQALEAAKLTVNDLDSVIMFGGVTRTPFVREALEAFTGKVCEVRSNVNTDESAAFGAAFKAARLSPSFKVKEIRDSDAAIYPAGVDQLVDGKQRQQKVFVPTSQQGTAKQLSFKDKDDFTFDLYQDVNGAHRPTLNVQTVNLTKSVTSLNENFGCTKDDISTRFTLRLSPLDGTPEVVSGSVSCEVEGSGKGSFGDSVKGLFGFRGKKGDQEPLKEEDTAATSTEQVESATSASASASSNVSESGKDSKPKKRTETVMVSFTTSEKGLQQPDAEDLARMRERLAAFDRSDRARTAREEALNVLEGFTYRARDLLTDAGFEEASTEAGRAKLTELLASTAEFLSSEGSSATTEVLRSKLSDLRALVDPVQSRREEARARPEKIKALQSALDQTKSLMEGVSEQLKKAAEQSSSAAAEAAASASSAAASPSSSSADDFADLEDDEPTSSSSSTTAKPSPTFSPYTKEDLESVTETYDSVSKWIKDKLSEQDKLKVFEDPSMTVKELEAKAEQLNKAMMNLVQKKLSMPKRPSSSKKSKTSKTKKAKTSSTTAAPSESSAAAAESGRPGFVTINSDDEMPSEEEILRMVREAKDKDPNRDRDEL